MVTTDSNSERPDDLLTLAELRRELGYPENISREERHALDSRLWNLRNGEKQKHKRGDGTYYDPSPISAKLLEGEHWVKRFGRILYRRSSLEVIRRHVLTLPKIDAEKSTRPIV
jgi:hypothetical protein